MDVSLSYEVKVLYVVLFVGLMMVSLVVGVVVTMREVTAVFVGKIRLSSSDNSCSSGSNNSGNKCDVVGGVWVQ